MRSKAAVYLASRSCSRYSGSQHRAVERVGQVAGDLLHPLVMRMIGDAAEDDAAGVKLDEEEDVEAAREASVDSVSKKVGGPDDRPVLGDELRPGALAAQLRIGRQAGLAEDVGNGGTADLVAEVTELIADPGVAPGGILAGDPADQLFECIAAVGGLPGPRTL